jgi:hypothetical protein
MRSMTGPWRRIGPLVVLLALGAPGSALADMVVLGSTAPAIAVGTVIQAGAQLTIPAGATVTLLAADGTQQTVAGPGGTVGGRPPAPSEAGVLGTLAALLDGQDGETRLGGGRGLVKVDCAAVAEPTSPEAIADLAKAGCIKEARRALEALKSR